MPGILDKDPGRPLIKLGILAPRVMSRRSVVLLTVLSIFVAGLFVASYRLTGPCRDGDSCTLSRLRHRLSASGDRPHRHQDNQHNKIQTEPSGGANDTDSQGAHDERDAQCAAFPDTSNILLVMKTGASEAYNKIPNQVMTTLKCHPKYFIFSDMAQEVAGQTIHDSLQTVLPDVKLKNKDFDLYFRQQKCPIDQESCNKNHNVGKQAWNLDKYKNIHMAEKAYAMRPNYDWYFFVDADTYVVWPTLVEWLRRLDPTKPHYIGSVAYVTNFPFGHGGSGYLVSQAAMSKFLKNKTGVANRWDQRASRECCGDYVFSLALKTETEIAVENARPTINGEKPHTLSYDEGEWCQPVVTMHHASAEEVSDLYAFEKERNFSSPMRFKDIYHHFVRDQLVATREDWDNMSDNVMYLNSSAHDYDQWELDRAKKGDVSALEMAAHQSFDDCRRACESLEKCLQYRFRNGICAIGHSIKHGSPTKEEEEERWRTKSGWNVDRIREWVDKHQDCGPVKFPINDKSWLS